MRRTFPAVTIAVALFGCAEDECKTQPAAFELHVRAMKLVLAERLTGDGGAQGQALAAGIEELAGKLRDGV